VATGPGRLRKLRRMPDPTSAAEEYAIVQGIAGPPKGRPDDPVGVADVDFPVARRGYDRGAVDAYVRRMSQIVAELEATRLPDAAVHRAVERVGEQISGILQRARDTAEQITAQSRTEAEDRLDAARQEAAQVVADAAQRAEGLDAEAERIAAERRRLIDDARELAGQVIALTDAATHGFPSEDPDTRTPSDAADQAAAEPEAPEPEPPEPDLGADSRLAELWALAAGQAPSDDLKPDLPSDQSGSERSAGGKEQPGHPDDRGEPSRPS
jgi:cell division septum initiation protein DivIVA